MDGSDFIKFPLHTHTIERMVKLVTKATGKLDYRRGMDLVEQH